MLVDPGVGARRRYLHDRFLQDCSNRDQLCFQHCFWTFLKGELVRTNLTVDCRKQRGVYKPCKHNTAVFCSRICCMSVENAKRYCQLPVKAFVGGVAGQDKWYASVEKDLFLQGICSTCMACTQKRTEAGVYQCFTCHKYKASTKEGRPKAAHSPCCSCPTTQAICGLTCMKQEGCAPIGHHNGGHRNRRTRAGS